MVERLLFHHADPNHPTFGGLYPIHIAASSDSPQCISHLIHYGGEINVQSQDGSSALLFSILSQAANSFKYLVSRYPLSKNLINMTNSENITPLLASIGLNDSNIAESFSSQLIRYGADTHFQLPDGLNPLIAATIKNYPKIVELILESDPQYPFERSLVSDGARALDIACSSGSVPIASYLIQKGSDINYQSERFSDFSPLHRAVYFGHSEIIHLLLSTPNVNPNIQCNPLKPSKYLNYKQDVVGGSTPFHMALRQGDLNIIRPFLLHHEKIDISIQDFNKDHPTPQLIPDPRVRDQISNEWQWS